MSKGRRTDWKPSPPQQAGAGAGGGLQPGMVEKIKKMQDDMAATQAALETELLNVTGAGGAITITITGHQRVQAIKVDPTLIDPSDASMLEDSLVAAINEAILASQEHSAKRLEEVTGGVQIPGLM